MRLEFTILWFENQPADVQTQMEEIEEHIREVGFVPDIRMEVNADNLEALSANQMLYNDYDLVVVDYDLGAPGLNGDHVAQSVRSTFGFTDIIFYSGQKTVDLRKLVHDQQIDGVYCLERTSLAERLGSHIEQVVERLSRLESMRGLLMGTVGKCDDILRDLLLEVHGRSPAAEQRHLADTLDGYVQDVLQHQGDRYATCNTFEQKLASRAVSSYHLQRLVLHITRGNEAYRDQRELLTRYNDEVLNPRNILGHAAEERTDQGWTVTSLGNPPIGTQDFPKLRRDMVTHLHNVAELQRLMGG